MFKNSLEVRLLPDFLEESQFDFSIVDRYIAGSKDRTALLFPLTCPQARRQEAQCTARPLKIGDCCPLFSHHPDQRWMERVCGAHLLPQRKTFFFRLLFFRLTF